MMQRETKFNITVITFLLFAVTATLFVLQDSRENFFEIERENITKNNRNNEAERDNNTNEIIFSSEIPEEKNEIRDIDLTWAIEEYKGKEISRVNVTEKVIALTFDAGANADGVDPILKILAENDIKGTFFLTGKFIEKYPGKVQEIIATGGDLGNHSYDHPYFTHLTNEEIKTEIQGAENTLAKLDGKFKPFLRSPYGDRNTGTLLTISENDYLNIRWTVDSLGWQGTSGGQSKVAVEQKVLKACSPGTIVMMHLGSNPDDKTHLDSEALPEIISKLREDGYKFMTLSEMLELEN